MFCDKRGFCAKTENYGKKGGCGKKPCDSDIVVECDGNIASMEGLETWHMGAELLRLPIAKSRSVGNHRRTHIEGPIYDCFPPTAISHQRGFKRSLFVSEEGFFGSKGRFMKSEGLLHDRKGSNNIKRGFLILGRSLKALEAGFL